jgi:hypothetical protein
VKSRSSSIPALAVNVSFERCVDPAFLKLKKPPVLSRGLTSSDCQQSERARPLHTRITQHFSSPPTATPEPGWSQPSAASPGAARPASSPRWPSQHLANTVRHLPEHEQLMRKPS